MSIIDFHNHVMPGVDDGASTEDEAAEALRAFLAHDTRHVIATPHVNGSITLNTLAFEQRMSELDSGWARLAKLGADTVPDINLYRGAEVMLDTPVPDLSDERLRLAGTIFALCEYPYMTIPPNSTGVIRTLIASGVTPVIAHPERYTGATPECSHAARWRNAGALLQLNAGSLTGRYGDHARMNAYALLERGFADYMCSDFHARGRPATSAALEMLTEAGGAEQMQLLISTNPRRLLAGERPLPVPPLALRVSIRDRVRRWLR